MEIYFSIAALAVLGLILSGLAIHGVIKEGKLDACMMVIMFIVLVLVTTDKVYASALLEIVQ